MIDLKQKMDTQSEPAKLKDEFYPSAYLRDIEGIGDLKVGQELKLVGKVTAVTTSDREGKKCHSVEIDLTGIDGEGKQQQLKDEKSKKSVKDDAEAIDKGLDEAADEEEKE